jgi:hypothetical protein
MTLLQAYSLFQLFLPTPSALELQAVSNLLAAQVP